MAVQLYSEDQIFQLAMGYFSTLFPGEDLSDKGFLGLLARAFAQVVVLTQYGIEQADDDGTPAYQQAADGTVRSRCSTEALDGWAFTFGLPSGTPGIYGRGIAKVSTGGSAVPTGTAGTLVLAGTLGVDSTGQVVVKTASDVTLGGPPNLNSVPIVSVTTGLAANLPAGSVISWNSPPAGLDPSATLTSALTGATDVESDSDLVARIIRRIQNPPRGGTTADYRAWCTEATDANGAALNLLPFIFPLRNGLNSVDCLITVPGSGPGRRPGAATQAAAQLYIDGKRPVTATGVRVLLPLLDPNAALRIIARVVPSTAKRGSYLYDWDDAGAATTITASTATSITCTVVPAALQLAVTAGRKPRVQIQVSSPGASPKPYQARVLSIAGTTLNLDTTLVFAPVSGSDVFHAGGSVVDRVAAAILAYVDSLGPSVQSGFADTNDPWESTVSINRLVDVCLEARDTDGTRLLLDVPVPNGVLIGVGAAAPAAASYVPKDVGSGIELAYLRPGGILVVKA